MIITVQKETFDANDTVEQLMQGRKDIGAAVTFTGYVRDLSDNHHLKSLFLEHYPGMTEQSLTDIAKQAQQRWPIDDIAIIHRIGHLEPSDPIVMVATLSTHRKAAFHAAEFIMDYLKMDAPFWKKEITKDGEEWVASKNSDAKERDHWEK